eukprot:NODE_687_length_1251_cov_112.977537_g549_i0.p1 GENE.NODE_687_length_1251_cov_112.977537_g549_i0~~NODE_687_length_1251_cov_112.977537_g549_i0.p1  ORF type:complete len:390 (-),score=93.83 NODE_687_length_1251_cov_112.977537_g549_i0:82-1227(-)
MGEEEMGPQVPDQSLAKFTGHQAPVHCVAFHPVNCHVVCSGDEGDTAYVWRWEEEGVVAPLHMLQEGHTDTITHVVFCSDGDVIATAGMDGKVCLWRFLDGSLINACTELQDEENEITSLIAGPPEAPIIASSSSGSAASWSTEGQYVAMYLGHADSITASRVVKTPAGETVLLTASTSTLKGFDPASGTCLFSIDANAKHAARFARDEGLTCISAPSGDIVVVGGFGGSVYFVSLTKRAVVAVMASAHPTMVDCAATPGHGGGAQQLVATSSMDDVNKSSVVSVWDVAHQRLRSRLDVPGQCVVKADWTADGQRLVAVLSDMSVGKLALWDARTGASEPVAELTGHRAVVHDFASCHSCGCGAEHIATCSDDRTVRIFRL